MFNISKKNGDEVGGDEAPADQNRSISGIELRDIEIHSIQPDFNGDNPRLGVNMAREELKNAIGSRQGRDLVLEVSQRPGDTNYCLHRGGNTRLDVLKELHAEWDVSDGDNPYSMVVCMVFPWVSEAEKSIITATENLVRGNFSFAEHSRAVVKLKERYDQDDIASRGVDFVEWAKSLGMSLNCLLYTSPSPRDS